MALGSDRDRATYLALLAVVMAVIAGSTIIILFPSMVPGGKAALIVARDGSLTVDVQPVIGELGDGLLVRSPPGDAVAALRISGDDVIEVYKPSSAPPYARFLPHPVLLDTVGTARVEGGLAPGECSITGFRLEDLKPIEARLVLAMAASEVDSSTITLRPGEGGEPEIRLVFPLKVGKSSFPGLEASATLGLGEGVTVSAEPGGGAIVYTPISALLARGFLQVSCGDRDVEVRIVALIPSGPVGGVEVEVLDEWVEPGGEYFLPFGSTRCLVAPSQRASPGDVVFNNLFDDKLEYTATGTIDGVTLGVNVTLDSVQARIVFIAGEDGYRSVCLYESLSRDRLPMARSSVYKP
ncbi:MAG: hypothetical protein F7C09_01150 [Aeropyrum sp.]|nr:hypothetical protein [Aeropyrum sp.]